MYIFFAIFGFLFVSVSATFLNYIYDIFSINKFTNFLSPINNENIFNKINQTVFPTIIWGIIELPILGSNGNFIISIIINLIIAVGIIYEIKYSCIVFFNKENNTINLVSIYIASLFGQLLSFMILKMKPFFKGNILIAIVGLLLLLGIYCFMINIPTKKKFFIKKRKKD